MSTPDGGAGVLDRLQTPYDVLGIEVGADVEAVRQAYRALARVHHPDLSADPVSADLFHQITEAYRTLTDPNRRVKADLLARATIAFRAARPGPLPPRPGEDVTVAVEFAPHEFQRGGRRGIVTASRVGCKACRGAGLGESGRLVRCRRCEGTGHRLHIQHTGSGDLRSWRPCGDCAASGCRVADPCGVCRGEGRLSAQVSVTVNFPPGLRDGAFVLVPGFGDAGIRNAPSGDLFVEVRATRS